METRIPSRLRRVRDLTHRPRSRPSHLNQRRMLAIHLPADCFPPLMSVRIFEPEGVAQGSDSPKGLISQQSVGEPIHVMRRGAAYMPTVPSGSTLRTFFRNPCIL